MKTVKANESETWFYKKWQEQDADDNNNPISGVRDIMEWKLKRIITLSVLAFIVLPLGMSSFFFTQEGTIDVIRTTGKVTDALKPGLHFKWPIIQTRQTINIQPRKYELVLQASTTGKNKSGETELQMPSTVTVAGNWNVDPDTEQVKQIVAKYGSITQFEDRILDPRVREVTLGVFPKNTIEQVITDRSAISTAIYNKLAADLSPFPVQFTDMQVSEVKWHERIENAVLSKQDAKLKRDEEAYKLEKQNLVAQQGVNTARAEAEGIKLKSVEKAAAIEREGLAEAAAIKAKSAALKSNPLLVQLTHEQQWDGKLPTTMMGGNQGVLMDIRGK